ncbi:hypothetical protein GBAR_LOCUS27341, partial [Geodia barretti]
MQLSSWPPGELPHPTAILSLVDLLTKAQRGSLGRHTVIMCSDGVGRTGTFICIHWRDSRLREWSISSRLQNPLASNERASSQMPLTTPSATTWSPPTWTVLRLMPTSKKLCNHKDNNPQKSLHRSLVVVKKTATISLL